MSEGSFGHLMSHESLDRVLEFAGMWLKAKERTV